jgi:hypothetical protein
MIVGYIHICQHSSIYDGEPSWKHSLRILLDALYASDVYNQTTEIRCGIVHAASSPAIIDDPLLKDPQQKFRLLDLGPSSNYERATLLHMRHSSDAHDPPGTLYWYLHTKGLKHFGTPKQHSVLDWVRYMLYWNITRWDVAVHVLKDLQYDTYGCDLLNYIHYSGNFWWATVEHVRSLPRHIPSYYTAPEDYVSRDKGGNLYNVFSSGLEGGGMYHRRYLPHQYQKWQEIPGNDAHWSTWNNNSKHTGLCLFTYRYWHEDLRKMSYNQCLSHYHRHGKHENRLTSLPADQFNVYDYISMNPDLSHMSKEQAIQHYCVYGRNENRPTIRP